MSPRPPYPGLRPFRRDEAEIFFGREEHADQLLDKLGDHHFVPVLGTSGSGKSSLVRAGLLPALESGFLARAGARWSVAEFRPGDRPVGRLAEALVCDTEWGRDYAAAQPQGDDPARSLERDLGRGPLALPWLLGVRPLPEKTRLLIVVDQFEELFRYHRTGSGAEGAAFVERLLAAAEHPDVYVVVTMRSDFLGDCALYSGLPEAINASLFLTPRLTREQMADAVQLPARVAGGDVAPELVNRLLDEAGGEMDQLPLLQHALMRLWDLDDGARTLTLAEYQRLGGLKQALNDHAEKAYAELTEQQRPVAEVLFRCLAERGPDQRDTRRPVQLGEVADLAGVKPEAVAQVVEVFRQPGRSFLTPPLGASLDRDTVLDIAHEALIRQWDRLRTWTADEAEQAELYQRLEAAAQRWHEGRGSRWIEPDVGFALKWQRERKPTPRWAARYGGDFGLAERFLDESHRAARRGKRLLWGSVIAVVLLLAGLSLFALDGRRRAEEATAAVEVALASEKRAKAVAEEEQRRTEVALASEKRAKAVAEAEQRRAQAALQSESKAKAEAEAARAELEEIARRQAVELEAERARRRPIEPEMVTIQAGTFTMGSPEADDEADSDERPTHEVTFGKPFAIGRYEVTFAEYDRFAYATDRRPPSDQGWGGRKRPVINVSWEDAVAYAEWLSEQTGKRYRLPSEAEWEYAARAGTTTRRFWGDDPAEACRYANVYDRGSETAAKAKYTISWEPHDCEDGYLETAPVGSFEPNAWQLHDMLGNVWEWVQDCWHDNYEGAPADGSVWLEAGGGGCGRRVIRGGSWLNVPWSVRSAYRYRYVTDFRIFNLGFRLAQDLK